MVLMTTVPVIPQELPLKAQADNLIYYGNELYEAGDKWGALEKFDHARNLYKSEGYPVEEANALNGIGQIKAELGRYVDALEAFDQARIIYRNSGEHKREAKIMTRMGLLYSRSGKYLYALSIFNKALELVDKNSREAGRTKNNIGAVYLSQKWYDYAKEPFDEALTIAQMVADHEGAATTLVNLGTLYRKQELYPQALTAYQDAFAIQLELDDSLGEAATLLSIGDVHLEQGDAFRKNDDISLSLQEYAKALMAYQDALMLYQKEEYQAGEAAALADIGKIFFRRENYTAALQQLLEALTICRAIRDSSIESVILEQLIELCQKTENSSSEALFRNDLGEIYFTCGRYDDAKVMLKQALELYKDFVDAPEDELRAWMLMGETALALENYDKAVRFFDKALTLLETVTDPSKKGRVLTHLAEAQLAQADHAEAADTLTQALTIYEALGEQAGKGQTLMLLGEVAFQQENYHDALNHFHRALPLQREAGYLAGEARTLIGIGEASFQITEYTTAMKAFQDALIAYQRVGDCKGEGRALAGIGEIHHIQRRHIKALNAYQEALYVYCKIDELAGQAYVLEQMKAIHEQQGDDAAKAAVLIALGKVYRDRGAYAEAQNAFDRASTLYTDINSLAGKAQALRQIGITYRILKSYVQSRDFLDRALSAYRILSDQSGEAAVLENIGELEFDRPRYHNAKTCYDQALALYRDLNDRAGEGRILMKIGDVYQELGLYPEAAEIQRQATVILAEVDDHYNLILALRCMGDAYSEMGLYWDALEAYRRALGLMTDTYDVLLADIPVLPVPAPIQKEPLPVLPAPSLPPLPVPTPLPTPTIKTMRTPTPSSLSDPTPIPTSKREDSSTPTPTPSPIPKLIPAEQTPTSLPMRYPTPTPTSTPTSVSQPERATPSSHHSSRSRQHLDVLEEKYDIQQRLHELPGQIETAEKIVDLALLEGDDNVAARYLEQLIEAFRSLDDTQRGAEALNQKGLIHVRQQDYVQAELAFREAATGDETSRAQAYNNLGILRYEQRQYDNAREFLNTSLLLAERSNDYTIIATALNNRALAYLGKGKELELQQKFVGARGLYGQALENFQQALHYFHLAYQEDNNLEDRQSQGSVLNNMGLIYHRLGHYHVALDQYHQALMIIQKIGGRGSESAVQHNIGTVYAALQQYGNALTSLQQALLIEQRIGNLVDEARTFSQIGYIYEVQGESFLTKPSQDFRNTIFIFKKTLAFFLRKTALSFYLQALSLQEDIRSGAKLEEFKISIAEGSVSIYQQIVQLLIQMNRTEEAFFFSERAKARTFLDMMGNRRLDLRKGIEQDLLKHEWQQRQEIRNIYQQLQEEQEKPFIDNTALIDTLKDQIAARQQRYAELITELKLHHPKYASLVSVNPLTLHEIQNFLGKQTSLLSYFITPQTTLAFVIAGNSFESIELTISENELRKKILQTRTALQQKKPVEPFLGELYDILIAPVESSLYTPTVGIVPHGVLHYLPFAALAKRTDANNASSHYVGDTYTLFTLPNAAVIEFIHQPSESHSEQQFLIMGSKGYPPLKYAEKEAITIGEIYSTNSFVGEEATGKAFVESAPSSTIIHLSSHARLNHRSPLSSGLQLHDGYLTIHDMYGLNLEQNTLTVLSACSTQLGRQSRGDDIIALNRAFLYAGAASVVASLWKVDDKSTYDLMISFHRHLKLGMSKSHALRQAQIEMRDNYPHPRDWAAFVLTGDPGQDQANYAIAYGSPFSTKLAQ